VIAEDLFGPNLGSLQGKTVRTKGAHVTSLVANMSHDIITKYRDITLYFEIMFEKKTAFLVTVSRHIRFGTTERLPSGQAGVVIKALLRVMAVYRQRGFRVEECIADDEFEALREDLAGIARLNVASEDEHVPEIERYIRTLKERTRAVYNTLPFKIQEDTGNDDRGNGTFEQLLVEHVPCQQRCVDRTEPPTHYDWTVL
jgi:hypothetical protein